jgi:hypothetical protein
MIELCVACLGCEPCMHVCLLCVVAFSGDRIERRVCEGGGDLWISRRRRSGTSQPRQAIYLLHIWILIIHFALFYSSSSYALFSILLLPLYSNSWRLSSTSRFVIIYIKMTPLTPIQHPYIRDLMVSIKVFGKLVVEPKTLGWENSRKNFEKRFSKTLE